jgi:hypothetical protein
LPLGFSHTFFPPPCSELAASHPSESQFKMYFHRALPGYLKTQ